MITPMHMGGWHAGHLLLWPLHLLSVFLFLTGVIFLITWAIKHLSEKKLKDWGWKLVLGGVLLCLLTVLLKGGLKATGKKQMLSGGKMDHVMERKDMDMSDPSMGQMTESLQGKTGDAFDRAFIDAMILHHQGAIDMAKAAQTSAKHAEIKRLAGQIITAQQREIDQMRGWQKSWGYGVGN